MALEENNNNIMLSGTNIKTNGKFTKILDPALLISILERRLPASCMVLNQLKSYKKFVDDMEVFMYGSGVECDTWILTKFYREDWELMISISAPEGPVAEEAKEVLLSSGVIDWDDPCIYYSLQPHISDLIMNIHVTAFGNIVKIYPCYLFHMEKNEALKLEISPPNINVEVTSLKPEDGTPFITENWKYYNDKTYPFVQKSIERLPSGGVFTSSDDDKSKKKMVCGAITPGFGLVSMLHTDPEHRRLGYASICMKYILKKLASEGLEPCLASEICNKTAVSFHRNVGLQNVARINSISHKLNI